MITAYLPLSLFADLNVQTNGFMQSEQPWAYAKALEKGQPIKDVPNADALADATEDVLKARMQRIVFQGVECLRLAAILLLPVMPTKMHELLDMLGVKRESRTFGMARYCADREYGVPFIEVGRGLKGALFPPLVAQL